jgi:hypothetical protein
MPSARKKSGETASKVALAEACWSSAAWPSMIY